MKERILVILDGYHQNHLAEETLISKIIAIFDPETGIMKGIEVESDECDLLDSDALLRYVVAHSKDANKFPLIAGYYDGVELNYSRIFSDNKITFGRFEYDSTLGKMKGRERTDNKGRLKRDLNRKVNRYSTVLIDAVRGKGISEFFKYCDSLYEAVEMVLLKSSNHIAWRGIQFSVENMAPKKAEKILVLISTEVIYKQ